MAIWSRLGLSGVAAGAGGVALGLVLLAVILVLMGAPETSDEAAPVETAAVPEAPVTPEPSPDPAVTPTPEQTTPAPTAPTETAALDAVPGDAAPGDAAPEDEAPAPLETPVVPVQPEAEEEVAALPEPAPLPEPTPAPEAEATPAPEPPAFDVVQVQPDGGGVIAGRGVPDRPVRFFLDGEAFAEAQADRAGKFGLVLDFPASDAPRALSMASVLEDGTEVTSSGTLLISPVRPPTPEPAPEEVAALPEPDTSASESPEVPSAPEVVAALPETPEAPAVVLADNTGVSVIQPAPRPAAPQADEAAPQVANVVIDTITYDTDGEVALTGRGAREGFVRVYLDGQPVTTTRITEDGGWQAPLPEVDAGVYTLRVDEVSESGEVTSRVETPFQREEPELVAQAPTGPQAVTVQPGFTLWAIAIDKYGSGFEYVRVYEANRDLIRDPDLIYPGQVFAIPEG